MLRFKQFITETAGKGSAQAHRGKISEEQFAHTFNKYSEGREAHKTKKPKASWDELHNAGMANARENGQLTSDTTEHKDSHATLGADEAHRTQWDTHHGALSVLHDMHHNQGRHPVGKTEIVADDNTGATAAKAMRGGRGHKEDPADVITNYSNEEDHSFHVRTHAANKDGKPTGVTGFSLKYTTTGTKDTKVSQPASSRLNEYSRVKNEHTPETEKDEKQRTTKLTNETQRQHDWLHNHEKIGKYFDKSKQLNDNLKATRYAHEATNNSSSSTRKASLAKITKHLVKHNVPKGQHKEAIEQLSNAHPAFSVERTKPHKQQAKTTRDAIKTKLAAEPHDFVRKLTQVSERRAGETSSIITIGRHPGSKNDPNDHATHGVTGRSPTVKSLHIPRALHAMERAAQRDGVPMSQRFTAAEKKTGVGTVISNHKGETVATLTGDANKPLTKQGDSSLVVSLPGGSTGVWGNHTKSLKHPDHA